MRRKFLARHVVHLVILLLFQEADDLEVGQCPSMPRFVPCGIVICREVVRLQDILDVALQIRDQPSVWPRLRG